MCLNLNDLVDGGRKRERALPDAIYHVINRQRTGTCTYTVLLLHLGPRRAPHARSDNPSTAHTSRNSTPLTTQFRVPRITTKRRSTPQSTRECNSIPVISAVRESQNGGGGEGKHQRAKTRIERSPAGALSRITTAGAATFPNTDLKKLLAPVALPPRSHSDGRRTTSRKEMGIGRTSLTSIYLLGGEQKTRKQEKRRISACRKAIARPSSVCVTATRQASHNFADSELPPTASRPRSKGKSEEAAGNRLSDLDRRS